MATVRQGSSVASWNTYPRLSRGTEIEPLVLVSRPDAMRRRVDFPHPDGPTMVTNSPGVTARRDVVDGVRAVREDHGDVVEAQRAVRIRCHGGLPRGRFRFGRHHVAR